MLQNNTFTIFKAATVVFFELNGRPRMDVKGIGYNRNYSDLRDQIDKIGSGLIEARYDYIVIEEVYEGIWGGVRDDIEIWLKWSDNFKMWQLCNKPKEAEGTVHWTL